MKALPKIPAIAQKAVWMIELDSKMDRGALFTIKRAYQSVFGRQPGTKARAPYMDARNKRIYVFDPLTEEEIKTYTSHFTRLRPKYEKVSHQDHEDHEKANGNHDDIQDASSLRATIARQNETIEKIAGDLANAQRAAERVPSLERQVIQLSQEREYMTQIVEEITSKDEGPSSIHAIALFYLYKTAGKIIGLETKISKDVLNYDKTDTRELARELGKILGRIIPKERITDELYEILQLDENGQHELLKRAFVERQEGREDYERASNLASGLTSVITQAQDDGIRQLLKDRTSADMKKYLQIISEYDARLERFVKSAKQRLDEIIRSADDIDRSAKAKIAVQEQGLSEIPFFIHTIEEKDRFMIRAYLPAAEGKDSWLVDHLAGERFIVNSLPEIGNAGDVMKMMNTRSGPNSVKYYELALPKPKYDGRKAAGIEDKIAETIYGRSEELRSILGIGVELLSKRNLATSGITYEEPKDEPTLNAPTSQKDKILSLMRPEFGMSVNDIKEAYRSRYLSEITTVHARNELKKLRKENLVSAEGTTKSMRYMRSHT